MKLCRLRYILLIALLSVLPLVAVPPVLSQSRFTVESVNIMVYRDGLVHVTQSLSVNEVYPEIFLSLLSSSVDNFIVLDENQAAIDYQIDGFNLTIFSLGVQKMIIEYDTNILTKKDAEIWTLIIDNPYSIVASLPENSTLTYLNQMPTAINTEGDAISLSLGPGIWEVSYLVPLVKVDEGHDQADHSPEFPIEYLVATIVAVAIIGVLLAFVLIRRRKPNITKIAKANPQLMKEDIEVIEFLVERNGKAFEAEIREKFPNMPRTSLWRLVRRLERLEIVEVKKIGLENQVQLK